MPDRGRARQGARESYGARRGGSDRVEHRHSRNEIDEVNDTCNRLRLEIRSLYQEHSRFPEGDALRATEKAVSWVRGFEGLGVVSDRRTASAASALAAEALTALASGPAGRDGQASKHRDGGADRRDGGAADAIRGSRVTEAGSSQAAARCQRDHRDRASRRQGPLLRPAAKVAPAQRPRKHGWRPMVWAIR